MSRDYGCGRSSSRSSRWWVGEIPIHLFREYGSCMVMVSATSYRLPIDVSAEAVQYRRRPPYLRVIEASASESPLPCWRYRDTAWVRLEISSFLNMLAR